jgi:hypothetical protein
VEGAGLTRGSIRFEPPRILRGVACGWHSSSRRSTTAFAVGWHALDVLVPMVDLGQQQKWLPTPTAFPNVLVGWLVLGWYWLTILAGWLLATVALAGMTGVLHRD